MTQPATQPQEVKQRKSYTRKTGSNPPGRPIAGLEEISFRKFNKEKDFVEYIILNIDNFCSVFLDEGIDFFKREYLINPIQPFAKGPNQKVDLFIRTKSGKQYLVECKNPNNVIQEVNTGIVQCLSYLLEAELVGLKIDGIFLLTTRLNPLSVGVIKRFNLPIQIWVLKETNFVGYKP